MLQSDKTDARDHFMDMAVFDRALSVGDAVFRQRLAVQMVADFTRLRAALILEVRGVAASGGKSVATRRAATHELKGLAATIGAVHLAQLALVHEITLDAGALAEASEQREALLEQIDGVVAHLGAASGHSAVA